MRDESGRLSVHCCGIGAPAVDELLQSTWLTLWRKFHEFDPEGCQEDFLKWAFVTGRFQAMNHRAKQSRDRLVVNDAVTEFLGDDAAERYEQIRAREFALRRYLEKLKPGERELLKAVYENRSEIVDVAGVLERKPTALSKILARIRDRLQH